MFIPFLKSHFEHVCINATKQVNFRLETFNKQHLFPMTLQRTAETAKWAIGAGFPMTDSYNFIIRPSWQPSIVNIWLRPCTLKKCLSVSLLINEYITIRFRALFFLGTYLHVLRHIPQCSSVHLTLMSCYTSTQYSCGCSQASVLYDVFFNVLRRREASDCVCMCVTVKYSLIKQLSIKRSLWRLFGPPPAKFGT